MDQRRMKDTYQPVIHQVEERRDMCSSSRPSPWSAAQSPSMTRRESDHEDSASQHGWNHRASSPPSLHKRYHHKGPVLLHYQSQRLASLAQPNPPAVQDREYHHQNSFPSWHPRYDHTCIPPSNHRPSGPLPLLRRRGYHGDMVYSSVRQLSPTLYNARSDDKFSQTDRDNARGGPYHTWKARHASTHCEQPRHLKDASYTPVDQGSTCFFWYHGHCTARFRCRKLHALTEPPTVVSPPPGYFHRKECTLRLCPLRVGGEPEGVSALKPIHRKHNHSGSNDKHWSYFNPIQSNGRKKYQMGNKVQKSKKRSAPRVARQLCTASRELLTTKLTKREIDAHHKSEDDPAEEITKEGCSNGEEEADWFLDGFEFDFASVNVKDRGSLQKASQEFKE